MPFIRIVHVFLLAVLLALGANQSWGQSGRPVAEGVSASTVDTLRKAQTVRIFLRNNKGWFRAINLAIYLPGELRPRIDSKTLLPWQRFSLVLPEGSSIYLLNEEQLASVKAGADLRQMPPSLTIQVSDQDEVYPLFP